MLAIISILAAISYPSISTYRTRCKNDELKTYIQVVNKSLRQYYAFKGKYPETLKDLSNSGYGVNIDNQKYNYNYVVNTSLKKYTLDVTLK